MGKFGSVLAHLLSPLHNPSKDMSVSNANQTNPLEAKRCEFASPDTLSTPQFYRHATEVTRNCVYRLFKTSNAYVLNMSGKIHTRERKLANKLTIKKNIHLNGA